MMTNKRCHVSVSPKGCLPLSRSKGDTSAQHTKRYNANRLKYATVYEVMTRFQTAPLLFGGQDTLGKDCNNNDSHAYQSKCTCSCKLGGKVKLAPDMLTASSARTGMRFGRKAEGGLPWKYPDITSKGS